MWSTFDWGAAHPPTVPQLALDGSERSSPTQQVRIPDRIPDPGDRIHQGLHRVGFQVLALAHRASGGAFVGMLGSAVKLLQGLLATTT